MDIQLTKLELFVYYASITLVVASIYFQVWDRANKRFSWIFLLFWFITIPLVFTHYTISTIAVLINKWRRWLGFI